MNTVNINIVQYGNKYHDNIFGHTIPLDDKRNSMLRGTETYSSVGFRNASAMQPGSSLARRWQVFFFKLGFKEV